jgi:hypothetical protein
MSSTALPDDVAMPPAMDVASWALLTAPLAKARRAHATAAAQGRARTISAHLKRVAAAHHEVKRMVAAWHAERDVSVHAKLDLVLGLLQPSHSSQPSQPSQPAPNVQPAQLPVEHAHVCVVCQEGVVQPCSELTCCRNLLHSGCACALYEDVERDALACPCCRRPYDEAMTKAAKRTCVEAWAKYFPASAHHFVLLSATNFHSQYRGCRLILEPEVMAECEGRRAGLSQWSAQGDGIHAFVARWLGGRWPRYLHTWLKISTGELRNMPLRFVAFENIYWDEPVLVCDHGDNEEVELGDLRLSLSSIVSATAVNPWSSEEPGWVGGCPTHPPGKICIVAWKSGSVDRWIFNGMLDHDVGLQLSFCSIDNARRTIVKFAATITRMCFPDWCNLPTNLPFVVLGGQLVPGSRIELMSRSTYASRGVVFQGWCRVGTALNLACSSEAHGTIEYVDAKDVACAKQL